VAASRASASRSSTDFGSSLLFRGEALTPDDDRCAFFKLPEFALGVDRSRRFVGLPFATVDVSQIKARLRPSPGSDAVVKHAVWIEHDFGLAMSEWSYYEIS
jgi:hypothetical protein